MALVARVVILSATIAALITMYLDRPKPVEVVETKYCPISFRAAYQDEDGKWVKVWAKGYGLCSEMDRYEQA